MPDTTPMDRFAVPPADLRRQYADDLTSFETTDELADVFGIVGQPRAAAAVEFGTGIGRKGFNIFAFGAPGTGKQARRCGTTSNGYRMNSTRRSPAPSNPTSTSAVARRSTTSSRTAPSAASRRSVRWPARRGSR
jgi:hypothetical protein